MTFADAECAGKRKQTFLIEMDQVVPWKGLIALVEPRYPKGEGGRALLLFDRAIREGQVKSLEPSPQGPLRKTFSH